MLGDDDVSGTTQGSRQIRSAAAVLKNHARSYMKQARDVSPLASGNGRSLRFQLRSPRPLPELYALDHSFGERRIA